MGKTLMNKLSLPRKALAAGLLVLSGCTPEALFGMGISGNAYKTHDPYAAQTIGNALMRSGEAQEGRSEVNVNVGNQDGNTQSNRNTSADEENPLTILAEDTGGFLYTRIEEGFIDNKKYLIITDEFIKKHSLDGKPGLWKISEKRPTNYYGQTVYEFYKEIELPKE
jgi:hypothetical protein